MSGQPKQGLDYAGWSVNIFDGDAKIDKLMDAQGWAGFNVYFYLCQMAYKFDGYFYRWTYDDSATTARRMGYGIRAETVRATVGLCFQIGLFDKGLFDRDSILTSRVIQKRYCAALQSRLVKSVIAEYWLLDDSENPKGLEKYSLNGDSPSEFPYSQGANRHLQATDGPKRKVKESIGKESVDDRAHARESSSVLYTPAVAFYRDRVAGPTASPRTLDELQHFESDLGSEVCIRAMMLALEQGKPKWNFISGILKNKQRDGIRSLAAWDAHEAERNELKRRQYGKQQSDSSSGSVAGRYGVKPDYDL